MDLRAYLKQNRKTYEAFAQEVGVDKSQVCRWVRKVRRPSLDQAERIHRATGGHVTAMDFMPADLPRVPSSAYAAAA